MVSPDPSSSSRGLCYAPPMTLQAECLSSPPHAARLPAPRAKTKRVEKASVPAPMATGDVVHKLHQYSELEWDQLARVLHVTERDLDGWLCDRELAMSAEQHLRKVFDVVKRIDRGWDAGNAALLLAERDGVVPVDLLMAGEYERAAEMMGPGPGREEWPPCEEDKSRRPLPPHILADALQDSIHVDLPQVRPLRRMGCCGGR